MLLKWAVNQGTSWKADKRVRAQEEADNDMHTGRTARPNHRVWEMNPWTVEHRQPRFTTSSLSWLVQLRLCVRRSGIQKENTEGIVEKTFEYSIKEKQ